MAAIPAQVVATADGGRVLVIIDRLAKNASTSLTADLDKQGPTETDLSVAIDSHRLVLANKFIRGPAEQRRCGQRLSHPRRTHGLGPMDGRRHVRDEIGPARQFQDRVLGERPAATGRPGNDDL